MAKMSRSMLKDLIKECLVEVLQEGLGFDNVISERVAKPKRSLHQSMGLGYADRPPKRRKHPILDAPALRENAPPSLSRRVPNTIASVSNDPIMQALLEDTAQSTLLNQDQAENHRGIQPQSDIPLDALGLMGANPSTWETLAFTNLQDSDKIKLE